MFLWFYVDLTFKLWVSCVTKLVICVLLDFLSVGSSLFSRCFSFGCRSLFFLFESSSLFIGCLSLVPCLLVVCVLFPVSFCSLVWFVVCVSLVSFGLVWFIVVRIGLSICLCMVRLVKSGLILIRLVQFVCLFEGQVLTICLFGESKAHTLVVC